MTTKRLDAQEFLTSLVGPLTFGRLLSSIRKCDEVSQTDFARQLGISRQNLCDIEKDRASVSPGRAARWAKTLGYSEHQFVSLALQSLIDKAGLNLEVAVATPKKRRKVAANVA